MKKYFRNLWAVVLIVAIAFSVSTVAMASQTDANAHFIFNDTTEEQPDLYVTKTVSSALEGYTIPDATFTFVLRWDKDGDGTLEYAENEIYYVYNEDGTQVWNDATSSYVFRTTAYGQFTLKAGQYARFEWAGQVEYEITELEMSGFTQTEPAGGQAATGTVDEKGTIVTFANMYIPEGGGDDETTELAIRKDISWPSGYEMPNLSDAEFTFQVTIDGSVYANKAYTIYDSSMTTEQGTGHTDENGEFTITGGQLALFEDVEVGVDYKVEEVSMGTGWRAVGTTSYAGATTSPIVYAYFTNEDAEFIVTKDRTDGVVGTEFTFILSDVNDSPMAGILYYIYDADGNLTGSGTTGEDGSFTIRSGEKLIFTGLPDGTEYKITEKEDDNFHVTADGTDSHDVTDTEDFDSIDTHTFVNEELTDITITKYGSRLNTESNLLAGAEFTIYVLNENGEYEQYGEPLTTGEDGTLTFENLPAGTYRIVETKTPAGYIALSDPIEVTLPYTSDTEVEGAVYSERDGIYYLYALDYTVDNTATLVMPNAGGNAWILIVLAIAGGAAAVTGVYLYRKRSGRKGEVKA